MFRPLWINFSIETQRRKRICYDRFPASAKGQAVIRVFNHFQSPGSRFVQADLSLTCGAGIHSIFQSAGTNLNPYGNNTAISLSTLLLSPLTYRPRWRDYRSPSGPEGEFNVFVLTPAVRCSADTMKPFTKLPGLTRSGQAALSWVPAAAFRFCQPAQPRKVSILS